MTTMTRAQALAELKRIHRMDGHADARSAAIELGESSVPIGPSVVRAEQRSMS